MKIQNTILAISVMSLFPISASAQGYNNVNINLNDVMVGQRMQDMAARLDDANRDGVFAPKKHHDKHNKNHKVAMLKGEISNTNDDDTGVAAGTPPDNVAAVNKPAAGKQ